MSQMGTEQLATQWLVRVNGNTALCFHSLTTFVSSCHSEFHSKPVTLEWRLNGTVKPHVMLFIQDAPYKTSVRLSLQTSTA